MVDASGDDYYWSYGTVRPASEDDSTCVPLLNGTHLSDGRIPVVLGIGTGILAVIFVFYMLLRHFAPDYTTISYVAEGDKEQFSISRGSLNDDFTVKKSFNWLIDLFYLRLMDVRSKCGPDAYSYLNLLRHLIFLISIITLFSISVILPVNYNVGDQHPNDQGFARTTMTNIKPSSGVLWLHTFFALLYLILTAATMFYYVIQLGKYQSDYSTSSILIQGSPTILGKEDIQHHFEEAGYQPTDIQFNYDVSRLIKLHKKFVESKEQLEIAQNVKDECNKELTVHIGINKLCCCYDPGVNAIAYYQNKCSQLHEEIKIEREQVNGKRLPLLFVSLASQIDTLGIVSGYRLCKNPPRSSLSDPLQSARWKVSAAPFPRDILWENLSVYGFWWWIRWIALNSCLVLFLFFFTTPTVVLSGLNVIRVAVIDNASTDVYSVSPFITNLIPILLLLLFSSLMPYLVARSTYLEAHWTKSFREQIILRKTYIFLVIMLILLPSVSLTSLNALAGGARNRKSLTAQLNCAFLPNNGAFFIGYIISAALIGTSLEWIRIVTFMQYVYLRFRAKSSAQRAYADKVIRIDFQFGIQYAYVLVIFAMIITLSITSPIAAPFGLIYLILKYYVDKYNIYNVHHPTSLRGRQTIHRTAVNFVMIGAFILQVCVLCYLVLRRGDVEPVSVFTIVMFSIGLFIWILSMFFDFFSYLMPTIRLKLGKEVTVFRSESDRYQAFEGNNMAKDSYVPSILTDEQWKNENIADENYQSFSSLKDAPRRESYH